MSDYTADVLLHIDRTLDEKGLNAIEHEIAFMNGVRSTCKSCKHPHLMLVDYDPMEITSLALLQNITIRGLRAGLVGL